MKKTILFFLLVFYIFFPHFIYEIADVFDFSGFTSIYYGVRWIAITLSFPVVISLLLSLLIGKNKILSYLVISVLALLAFITLFLYFNFDTILSPWILLLLKETNSTESSEFISRYLFTSGTIYSFLFVILPLILAILLERKIKQPLLQKKWQKIVAGCLLLVFAPVGLYMFGKTIQLAFLNSQYKIEEWRENQGEYAMKNTVTNVIYSYLFLNASSKDNEKAIQCCIEAGKIPAICQSKDSLNIIFVIGESFNKYHASIYGYYLDTTPTMDEEKSKDNLFVFSNVVSPFNMTTFSVKNLISTNILEDNETWFSKPAFPILFKKAGYYVTMWDNQRPDTDVSTYDYALGSYLYASQIIPLSYSIYNTKTFDYDEQMIQSFQNHYHNSKYNLNIFHLMGQHSDAAERFPDDEKLKVFKTDNIKRNDLDEWQKQIIADYDNATLYNDGIIRKLIEMFSKSCTVLVYLSDHGEELFDYRNFIGRTHEKKKSWQALKYQYEIPFVVWCSDSFKEKYPEKVKAIKKAMKKPFLSSNVSHMLLSLAFIDTPFYKEEKDVLSDKYRCGQRILQNNNDYDAIMKRKIN